MKYVNYAEYITGNHFLKLKRQLITDNPRAKCCICGNWHKSQLTLHHEIYNYFHERLNRDVFIVCSPEGWCHTQLTYLWGVIKLPYHPYLNKKRRQWLRFRHVLKSKNPTEILYSLGAIMFT